MSEFYETVWTSGTSSSNMYKKEVLKPVPGVLAQIAHIIIFSIITVGTASGIMYGTLRGMVYFTPVYAEAPEINLKTTEHLDVPFSYKDWDWEGFSVGSSNFSTVGMYVSVSKSLDNRALLINGVSEFNDTVEIKGHLIVNGVDITPKPSKGP